MGEQFDPAFYTIDLAHIRTVLARHLRAVLAAAAVCALLGLSLALWVIPPSYASSLLLYVNNSAFSPETGSFPISASELTAAQSLVNTYGEILRSRTTLEQVLEHAEVPYTWQDLSRWITSEASNNTEILRVTVTTKDPQVSSSIANAIAQVLPRRIAQVVQGASVALIDAAVPDPERISPSIPLYTALGLALGTVLALVFLIVTALGDDTVYSEAALGRICPYPLLARIPHLPEKPQGRCRRKTDPGTQPWRLLGIHLQYALRSEKCPILGITGPTPGAGSTTTAIHLARTLAESGSRVLLAGREIPGNPLSSPQPENLQILPGGALPAESRRDARRLGKLLPNLRERFDYVILDLPPAAVFPDAAALSPLLTGLVVVVRENATRRRDLERCLGQFPLSGTRVLGCVLNDSTDS